MLGRAYAQSLEAARHSWRSTLSQRRCDFEGLACSGLVLIGKRSMRLSQIAGGCREDRRWRQAERHHPGRSIRRRVRPNPRRVGPQRGLPAVLRATLSTKCPSFRQALHQLSLVTRDERIDGDLQGVVVGSQRFRQGLFGPFLECPQPLFRQSEWEKDYIVVSTSIGQSQ